MSQHAIGIMSAPREESFEGGAGKRRLSAGSRRARHANAPPFAVCGVGSVKAVRGVPSGGPRDFHAAFWSPEVVGGINTAQIFGSLGEGGVVALAIA